MENKTRKYDPANYLQTTEDVAAYLDAAFECGDKELVLIAIGNIFRSEGMRQIARETGVTDEDVYGVLGPGPDYPMDLLVKAGRMLGAKMVIPTSA